MELNITAKPYIDEALRKNGMSMTHVAETLGWSKQRLSGHILRDTLRLGVLTKIMDIIGVDIVFVDRKTGEQIIPDKHLFFPAVRCSVDGTEYDTSKSTLYVSNGEEELYRYKGKFYLLNRNNGNIITPMNDDAAFEFFLKCKEESKK